MYFFAFMRKLKSLCVIQAELIVIDRGWGIVSRLPEILPKGSRWFMRESNVYCQDDRIYPELNTISVTCYQWLLHRWQRLYWAYRQRWNYQGRPAEVDSPAMAEVKEYLAISCWEGIKNKPFFLAMLSPKTIIFGNVSVRWNRCGNPIW